LKLAGLAVKKGGLNTSPCLFIKWS